MKILIAEDDFGSRMVLQKLLTDYGSCDLVFNGKEAIKAFQLAWEDNAPYNVIFMDIMMPEMDGHSAVKEIRKLEKEMTIPSGREVRIFMASILEDPKNVIQAYKEGGATGYIVKPVTQDKIREEFIKTGLPV